MDDQLKQPKERYENTEIPPRLGQIIEQEIEKDRCKYTKREGLHMNYKRFAATAAVCSLVFVGSINLSSNVALAMYNVPIIGDIARVVTFREYNFESDALDLNVKIPKIENTGNADLEKRINDEINKKMDVIIAEGEERAAEYKKAAMDTGTPEEEVNHLGVYADYELKYSDENMLSFVITKVETLASAYSENYVYNIDLKTGKDISLLDLLGSDYKKIIDESVVNQINQRSKDEDQIFFAYGPNGGDTIEGFTGIKDGQKFYINASGNVVVVFDKYEIAPGFMGTPEFEIIK